MIWITNRCLSDYVQKVNRNGNGAGFGRDTPIPFHPKIYNYFPSPPKPRAGWGMHSHPNFETTIKIPSPPCLDLGMFFFKKQDWKSKN